MNDDIDRELIAALQADGRRTNRSLADEVGLAPSSTLQRVRDLEDEGVITGYHAEIDLRRLGRNVEAMVFVRLRSKTEDVIAEFTEHVWSIPDVISVSLISGAEDMIIHVAVPHTDRLREVILRAVADHEAVIDERTALLFETRRRHVIEPA